jgi:hypothetical protein
MGIFGVNPTLYSRQAQKGIFRAGSKQLSQKILRVVFPEHEQPDKATGKTLVDPVAKFYARQDGEAKPKTLTTSLSSAPGVRKSLGVQAQEVQKIKARGAKIQARLRARYAKRQAAHKSRVARRQAQAAAKVKAVIFHKLRNKVKAMQEPISDLIKDFKPKEKVLEKLRKEESKLNTKRVKFNTQISKIDGMLTGMGDILIADDKSEVGQMKTFHDLAKDKARDNGNYDSIGGHDLRFEHHMVKKMGKISKMFRKEIIRKAPVARKYYNFAKKERENKAKFDRWHALVKDRQIA